MTLHMSALKNESNFHSSKGIAKWNLFQFTKYSEHKWNSTTSIKKGKNRYKMCIGHDDDDDVGLMRNNVLTSYACKFHSVTVWKLVGNVSKIKK